MSAASACVIPVDRLAAAETQAAATADGFFPRPPGIGPPLAQFPRDPTLVVREGQRRGDLGYVRDRLRRHRREVELSMQRVVGPPNPRQPNLCERGELGERLWEAIHPTHHVTAANRDRLDRAADEESVALVRKTVGPESSTPTSCITDLGQAIVEKGVEDGVEHLQSIDRA